MSAGQGGSSSASGAAPARRDTPKTRAFRERYGPAALVTGAAGGIGHAFAESLAARGFALHLLDVQAEPLDAVAAELRERYEVSCWALPVDLAQRDFLGAVDAIVERAGAPVGLVVCNAAIGLEGPFLEESLDDLHRAVDVNCQASLTLAHRFAPEMVERGRGGLVFVSSGTALHGSPGYANYAATKAFALSFGESLWYELQPHGVDVLAYVPGPTNTPGLRRSLPHLQPGRAVGPVGLPGETAEAALDALGKRASAAREREHASRLSARRKLADRFVAERAAVRAEISGAAAPATDDEESGE